MDIAWHNTLKHIKITKTWQNTKNINKLKITGHPIECEFAVHKPLKPYTAKNRLGSLKAETVKKRWMSVTLKLYSLISHNWKMRLQQNPDSTSRNRDFSIETVQAL